MQLHYRIARSPLTSCLQRSATQCAPPKCYPGSVIKQIEVICCRSRLEPLDADIHKGDKSEAIVDAVGGCTCNVIHVYFGCDCKAEKRVKMSGWVAEWLAKLLNLHSGVILTCDGLLTDGCDATRNGRWGHCHLKCRMDSPNSTNKCCTCGMVMRRVTLDSIVIRTQQRIKLPLLEDWRKRMRLRLTQKLLWIKQLWGIVKA